MDLMLVMNERLRHQTAEQRAATQRVILAAFGALVSYVIVLVASSSAASSGASFVIAGGSAAANWSSPSSTPSCCWVLVLCVVANALLVWGTLVVKRYSAATGNFIGFGRPNPQPGVSSFWEVDTVAVLALGVLVTVGAHSGWSTITNFVLVVVQLAAFLTKLRKIH